MFRGVQRAVSKQRLNRTHNQAVSAYVALTGGLTKIKHAITLLFRIYYVNINERKHA